MLLLWDGLLLTSTLPSNLGGLCVNAECVYFKVGNKNNGKLFKLLQNLVCQHFPLIRP